MAEPITLTSDQKLAVGVTILDKGGEAYETLPSGFTTTFESSDPSILGVVVRPDGLNADLSTDNIGTVTLTISTTKANGEHLADSPDVTTITVANAEPGSQNVRFGAPEPE